MIIQSGSELRKLLWRRTDGRPHCIWDLKPLFLPIRNRQVQLFFLTSTLTLLTGQAGLEVKRSNYQGRVRYCVSNYPLSMPCNRAPMVLRLSAPESPCLSIVRGAKNFPVLQMTSSSSLREFHEVRRRIIVLVIIITIVVAFFSHLLCCVISGDSYIQHTQLAKDERNVWL